MTTRRTAMAAWVIGGLVMFVTGYAIAGEDEVPRAQVVVKAGDQGSQYLRDFDARFRTNLKQKNVPDKDVDCLGCDALVGGGKTLPDQLSYFFPRKSDAVAAALADAWLQSAKTAADTLDWIIVPDCNSYYPPTCYYRPTCPGNPTPYCGSKKTGTCLPGCT